jgi:cyclic dehypoxanthinyl futalosine synthase
MEFPFTDRFSGECYNILKKAWEGERISSDEALVLYEKADFIQIQAVARELRNRKISGDSASYTMFRVVNYTNRCIIRCAFCSFQSTEKSDVYILTQEQIIRKMEEAVAQGADQMFFQGGVHPDIPLSYYTDILSAVKERFGKNLHIRAFSPVEIMHLAKNSGTGIQDLLGILKKAGLDSIPGAGAEILSERMRKILSPRKASVSEWLDVMSKAHEAGLRGSANIVFGSEEKPEEITEHLNHIRTLQDRTGGFHAFVVWSFQQQTEDFKVRYVSPQEYLKVLGISRIFLDNIDHIETSLLVQGPVLGALALHSGADDISSVVIEENVLENNSFTKESDARLFLRNNGFIPKRRDFDYIYSE